MAGEILKPVAPNLPLAPQMYSPQYNEQLNNVLRLYFNQLTNAIGALESRVSDLQNQASSAQTLTWLDM
jgi:hypothetical protein